MSEKSKLYQQGDVLLFSVEKIPDECKTMKADHRGWVLAEGEATGHAHTIPMGVDSGSVLFEDEGHNLWLNASKSVTIKHQEHKAVTLPKGKYKIGIVKEVDPFSEEIHKVRD